jgi:hypothetical protein
MQQRATQKLQLVAAPSELVAAPSELVAAPSELVAAPSELVASPSELFAQPSEHHLRRFLPTTVTYHANTTCREGAYPPLPRTTDTSHSDGWMDAWGCTFPARRRVKRRAV